MNLGVIFSYVKYNRLVNLLVQPPSLAGKVVMTKDEEYMELEPGIILSKELRVKLFVLSQKKARVSFP